MMLKNPPYQTHSKPKINFHLPDHLKATTPPEERGLQRDQVQMMVSYHNNNEIFHSQFRHITDFLQPGDLVVINTSGTLNAALKVQRNNQSLHLHISTQLPSKEWLVELRYPQKKPFLQAKVDDILFLPGKGKAKLISPHKVLPGNKVRLWRANLDIPKPLTDYLQQYGFPIGYDYLTQSWPGSYYQTVYKTEMGSAEMPSAGRAFTPELITALIAKGVQVAPILLHTGVSSLEHNEKPYQEFYRVPRETARLINMAGKFSQRVIAIGTTVVRALETVTDSHKIVHPQEGWTNLVITPGRKMKVVNGLLTGFHEPQASHLDMLTALAGHRHIALSYQEALKKKYLWHEFGDLHLLLP